MSRRTIKRGVKPAKPKEPATIDPQARRRWEQRQADDVAVIEIIKAGDMDLSWGPHAIRIAAERLGWTQGRLRAAMERIQANVRAGRNQREEGKNV